MRPDMTGALDAFDEMVEALEENEDMVECKECFDLFPKADCEKSEVGYVCPVCKGLRAAPARTDFVDPYDCYTQDFPEVRDYNPDSIVDYEREPDLGDALSDLIKDEYEAIDGYEIADETIQKADIEEEDKDEILDTLDHIKEEEEEHIDELKDLCLECDKKPETEADKETEDDLDELFDANVNLSLDGGEGNDVSVLSSHDPEDKGSEKLAEDAAEDTEEPEDAEDTEESEEDPESEDEKSEEPDLEAAYTAAIEVANETGVGQVFGYAKKDTEEFVAIDLVEVDDPDAIEQDLEAVYDDMGYAYVAFPEKTLEESLFESTQLHEAGFLTNLFTKENQTLDNFFTNGYVVKVGNSVIQTVTSWADAEKLATQQSKANAKDAVTVSAKAVPAADIKNAGWSDRLVSDFGGKDFVLATYRNGKVTLVDKAADLTKRLKAETKSMKLMNKSGATSTSYNDQYGRTAIDAAFTDSTVSPTATTVVKLTNILFDKYEVYQGMARPMSDEAKATGNDIKTVEVKSMGEFTDLDSATKTAASKSNRVPEEGSSDAPVCEVFGYFKDFDSEVLTYLEKYVTRSKDGGALEAARVAGGPVHLFTYSRGKAIQDTGCASLSKFIKMEANILEDLEEAGIDVSGKPGIKPPKKDESNEDEGDADLDFGEDSDEETPKDPKDKLKAVLGEKKDAAGYTADSYAKYETLYEKIIAWIDGLKKPEAVTDEKIETYKKTAESKLVEDPDAGDADLDLEDGESSEDGTSEDSGEESGDKSEERGSAEFNKKYHGVSVANTAIQAFRKLMMLTSMKVYDATGAEVTTDASGAKKITAETLNDFEVEVKGERQPLAAWISKMVKVGALHESFGDIFSTQLTEAEEPAKTQKTSEKDYLKDQGITDAALSSFKKLFALTDLKVYDAFDKPVTTDKTGMAKMSSYTLVDFTVEYRGKKIPLIQFVAKLAKEKILKESLYTALKESTDLEDAGEAFQSAAAGIRNMTSAMKESILNLSPADIAECVDSSRVELWGLEEPEDGVAQAVLIKSYDDVPSEEVQSCHDEMLDLDGMFTFCFTASGKPSVYGWNAEQLRELTQAGLKGISFDDPAYEEAINLAWRIK